MRAGILALTAAVLIGACSGNEVTTFQRGADGKPIKGTEHSTLMTPEEEIDLRQNAVHTGVSYYGDCFNGDANAYGNEGVFFRDRADNTSPCTFVGGGGSTTWGLSFDDAAARYIAQNQSMDNNVRYYKAHVGNVAVTANRVTAHLSTTFGGGTVYVNNNIPNDATVSFGDLTKIGSSFIMCAQNAFGCF